MEDMTRSQQEWFERVKQKRYQSILSSWKKGIEAHLEYRNPNLIDAHQLRTRFYQKSCENLYVFPCFMKAGKQNYLVHLPDSNYFSMHNTICDFRSENPPKCKLESKHSIESFSAETTQEKKSETGIQ